MAVDGVIKEKKRKKKIKEDGVGATAENGGTKDITDYQHASVQTTTKTEQSEVNICKGEQHEYDTTEKKKKKKQKKKIKEVNENVAVYHDTSVQTPVKTELLEINISEGGLEKSDLPQKEKKKKKKMKKESEHHQENVMEVTYSEPEDKIDGQCIEESRIKKKRKKEKGKKQMEESATEAGEIKKKKKKDVEVKEEVDVGHSGKMKKKKRKNIEDEEQSPESGDGGVKKKRKKTEKCIKTVESDAEPTKKRKKKEQNATEKTKNDKEMKVKVNKEKLSLVEEEMNETDVNTEKRSKNKKKRSENLDEGQRLGPAPVNGTKAEKGNVTEETRSSKHKMKKGIKLEVDDVIEEEPQENRMSKQEENKTTEKKDVVFLSARPGNQDEVSIDQARRLALQEDIDKESQPKPTLGQWSTAQFDSSEKQAKFMRLMGGFKKSSQPITGSSGHANMSLGKEGQQTLQQGLLGEFERAQSRRLDFRNKGIGLGFTPPSNKKFAIDVNTRNSVRFDD